MCSYVLFFISFVFIQAFLQVLPSCMNTFTKPMCGFFVTGIFKLLLTIWQRISRHHFVSKNRIKNDRTDDYHYSYEKKRGKFIAIFFWRCCEKNFCVLFKREYKFQPMIVPTKNI